MSKGDEEDEYGVAVVEALGVETAAAMAVFLKVEERWRGDLEMAGEAMGGGDLPLGSLWDLRFSVGSSIKECTLRSSTCTLVS